MNSLTENINLPSKITPVYGELRRADEAIEQERKELHDKANKFKLFILRTKLSIRGFFKMLSFKKDATYIGGRYQRPSIYMGDRKFYEQIGITVPGFCYYTTKQIQYKYWELGMFKWTKSNIKVIKDKNVK